MSIKGQQGSWFATTPIGELPVLKSKHIGRNGHYHDPHPYDLNRDKDRKYIEAIKTGGRVVMAKFKKVPEGAVEERDGYLGQEYFLVDSDSIHLGENGLTCRVIARKKFDDPPQTPAS
jgi:hypothetical protein